MNVWDFHIGLIIAFLILYPIFICSEQFASNEIFWYEFRGLLFLWRHCKWIKTVLFYPDVFFLFDVVLICCFDDHINPQLTVREVHENNNRKIFKVIFVIVRIERNISKMNKIKDVTHTKVYGPGKEIATNWNKLTINKMSEKTTAKKKI